MSWPESSSTARPSLSIRVALALAASAKLSIVLEMIFDPLGWGELGEHKTAFVCLCGRDLCTLAR